MFTKRFWVDTFERAISTAAQFVLAILGLSEDAIGVIEQQVSWELLLWAALSGFVLTFVKALATVRRTGSASAVVLDKVESR